MSGKESLGEWFAAHVAVDKGYFKPDAQAKLEQVVALVRRYEAAATGKVKTFGADDGGKILVLVRLDGDGLMCDRVAMVPVVD